MDENDQMILSLGPSITHMIRLISQSDLTTSVSPEINKEMFANINFPVLQSNLLSYFDVASGQSFNWQFDFPFNQKALNYIVSSKMGSDPFLATYALYSFLAFFSERDWRSLIVLMKALAACMDSPYSQLITETLEVCCMIHVLIARDLDFFSTLARERPEMAGFVENLKEFKKSSNYLFKNDPQSGFILGLPPQVQQRNKDVLRILYHFAHQIPMQSATTLCNLMFLEPIPNITGFITKVDEPGTAISFPQVGIPSLAVAFSERPTFINGLPDLELEELKYKNSLSFIDVLPKDLLSELDAIFHVGNSMLDLKEIVYNHFISKDDHSIESAIILLFMYTKLKYPTKEDELLDHIYDSPLMDERIYNMPYRALFFRAVEDINDYSAIAAILMKTHKKPALFNEMIQRFIAMMPQMPERALKHPSIKKAINVSMILFQNFAFMSTDENAEEIENVRKYMFMIINKILENESIIDNWFESQEFVSVLSSLLFEPTLREYVFGIIKKYYTNDPITNPDFFFLNTFAICFGNFPKPPYVTLIVELFIYLNSILAIKPEFTRYFMQLVQSSCRAFWAFTDDQQLLELLDKALDYLIFASRERQFTASELAALQNAISKQFGENINNKFRTKLIQLIAGSAKATDKDIFIIRQPYALVTFLKTDEKNLFENLKFISTLCIKHRENCLHAHKGEFDLFILNQILEIRNNPEFGDRVELMLEIFFNIAIVVSSSPVIHKFYTLLSPIDQKTICYHHYTMIKKMTEKIEAYKHVPSAFMSIKENKGICSDIKFQEGSCFSIWYYAEGYYPDSVITLVSVNDALGNGFDVQLINGTINLKYHKEDKVHVIDSNMKPVLCQWSVFALSQFKNRFMITLDSTDGEEMIVPDYSSFESPLTIEIGDKNGVADILVASFAYFEPGQIPVTRIVEMGPGFKNTPEIQNRMKIIKKNGAVSAVGGVLDVPISFPPSNFIDVLSNVSQIDTFLPLFKYLSFESDKPTHELTKLILDLFSSLMMIKSSIPLEIAKTNKVNIIALLIKQIKGTYENYLNFYEFFDKIKCPPMKVLLLSEILMNRDFLLSCDVEEQIKIVKHWKKNLFTGPYLSITNRTFSFRDFLSLVYTRMYLQPRLFEIRKVLFGFMRNYKITSFDLVSLVGDILATKSTNIQLELLTCVQTSRIKFNTEEELTALWELRHLFRLNNLKINKKVLGAFFIAQPKTDNPFYALRNFPAEAATQEMFEGLLKALVERKAPVFFPYVCSIAIKLNKIDYLIENFPKVDNLFQSKENQFFMAYLIVETENRDLYKLFDMTYGGNLIKQIIVVSYLKGKDPENIVSHFIGYHLDNPFKNDWTEDQIKGFVDAINVFMFTQFKPYSVIQEKSLIINRRMPLLKGVKPPDTDYAPVQPKPRPKPASKPQQQQVNNSNSTSQEAKQTEQNGDNASDSPAPVKKVVKKRIVKKVIVKKKVVKKNPDEEAPIPEEEAPKEEVPVSEEPPKEEEHPTEEAQPENVETIEPEITPEEQAPPVDEEVKSEEPELNETKHEEEKKEEETKHEDEEVSKPEETHNEKEDKKEEEPKPEEQAINEEPKSEELAEETPKTEENQTTEEQPKSEESKTTEEKNKSEANGEEDENENETKANLDLPGENQEVAEIIGQAKEDIAEIADVMESIFDFEDFATKLAQMKLIIQFGIRTNQYGDWIDIEFANYAYNYITQLKLEEFQDMYFLIERFTKRETADPVFPRPFSDEESKFEWLNNIGDRISTTEFDLSSFMPMFSKTLDNNSKMVIKRSKMDINAYEENFQRTNAMATLKWKKIWKRFMMSISEIKDKEQICLGKRIHWKRSDELCLDGYPVLLKPNFDYKAHKNAYRTKENNPPPEVINIIDPRTYNLNIKDKKEIIFQSPCSKISAGAVKGFFARISKTEIQLFGPTKIIKTFHFSKIQAIYPRSYAKLNDSIEIFFIQPKSVYLYFHNPGLQEALKKIAPHVKNFNSSAIVQIKENISYLKETKLTDSWVNGKISNFEYLLELNKISGRSFSDLTHYPIFPWVIRDYTNDTLELENKAVYRNLKLATTQLGPSKEKPPHQYFSSIFSVNMHMVREEPFASWLIMINKGKFPPLQRLFNSLEAEYAQIMTNPTSFNELEPQFFYAPEIFINLNRNKFKKFQLPPYNDNPIKFVYQNRKALESEYVTSHLNEWIDIVWGIRQHDQSCQMKPEMYVEDKNTKSGAVRQMGHVPLKLFAKPHPPSKASKPSSYEGYTRQADFQLGDIVYGCFVDEKLPTFYAFSKDGSVSITTYDFKKVSTKNLKPIAPFHAICQYQDTNLVAYSPAGKNTIMIFNSDREFTLPYGQIRSFAASKNILAIISEDETVYLINNTMSTKQIPLVITDFTGTCECVAVSEEFTVTVIAQSNGLINVFHRLSGMNLRQIQMENYMPIKVLVSPGWGFICVFSSQSVEGTNTYCINIFTINGLFVGRIPLKAEILNWTTWKSAKGFDFMAFVDKRGTVFAFEIMKLDLGNHLHIIDTPLYAIYYYQSLRSVAVLGKNGRLLMLPFDDNKL